MWLAKEISFRRPGSTAEGVLRRDPSPPLTSDTGLPVVGRTTGLKPPLAVVLVRVVAPVQDVSSDSLCVYGRGPGLSGRPGPR